MRAPWVRADPGWAVKRPDGRHDSVHGHGSSHDLRAGLLGPGPRHVQSLYGFDVAGASALAACKLHWVRTPKVKACLGASLPRELQANPVLP